MTKYTEHYTYNPDSDTYIIEASSLTALLPSNESHCCPRCGERVLISDLKNVMEHDGEVAGWVFQCRHCDAKIKIFND